ncbi:hypothetical protein [Novosphingobium sp. FSW06-99]|uniref:hypothetical protein n=1 Tax=Novosphingobium sp. FSW06-99 TaxID=1739113 RepID=UPI00076C1592|nr:hypothetical protein [Novosphingobium sp. FSW06-99]KUR80733.1 hypothetical protein AQZ49_01515 [Novosphingobium sp. FSW06-99]
MKEPEAIEIQPLRLTVSGDGYIVTHGEFLVGLITPISGRSGKWLYSIDRIDLGYGTKRRGIVSSKAAAKRAFQRTWTRFVGQLRGG